MSEVVTSPSPSTIYVSELLRTWETAVLLFLSEKNTKLTLFISPYLREWGPIPFPSDDPGHLQEQVNEFIRFIVFLGQLKKISDDFLFHDIRGGIYIPTGFTIILKHFSGDFGEDFFSGIVKPENPAVTIVEGNEIEIKLSPVSGDTSISTNEIENIKEMLGKIIPNPKPTSSPYVSYLQPDTAAHVLQFPTVSADSSIGNIKTPSEPPSIAGFVQWCKTLSIKPHGDDIVYFVSHSGTMKTFVKKVKDSSEIKPSDAFDTEYNTAIETNTWSLFFNEGGQTYKGFRHAYSCDNRYEAKGLLYTKERVKAGGYTNLALWGILSTLLFSNTTIPELIKDKELTSPGLKICRGMKKEDDSLHNSDKYDGINMLCGKQRDRLPTGDFILDFGHCGTRSSFTSTTDEDCIRITMKPLHNKVVLYYNKKSNKENGSIEVRFFKTADSDTTYFASIPFTNNCLTNIVAFLSQPTTTPPSIHPLPPANHIALSSKLTDTISIFINSDRFKGKTKNHPAWNSVWRLATNNSTVSTGSIVPVPVKDIPQQLSMRPEIPAIGGRTIKKIRKHKNYKIMKKYTRKYRKQQSKKKSRRIQKRKRATRRKSRTSRK